LSLLIWPPQGLIPIVGAAREPGTSMLIEDVACPVDKLADMMIDLIDMFQRYGYNDASCFGHALEGNLHLVFSQVRGWEEGGKGGWTGRPLWI
jgi:D-lactate dehydrogenase